MPRRSVDSSGKGSTTSKMSTDSTSVQRKTERSHEENQERAYIAASRRADRSIEARVQSARMASEIHKKRTGRGFRISEEIVRKEEMYEEEEDEFPRSYRILGAHMQTNSAEMNSRVEAYMTGRLAMSAYMSKVNENWNENNINQLFAASFPNAKQQAQQLSQRMSQSGTYENQSAAPQRTAAPASMSPHFQPVTYQHGANRHGSLASVSPTESNPNENPLSPSLTQASSPTPDTPATASFSFPTGDWGISDSTFTSELPQEMKLMMMGGSGEMNYSGMYNHSSYDQNWMPPTEGFSGDQDLDFPMKLENFGNSFQNNGQWDESTAPPSSIPGATDEPWDMFIDDNAWDNTQ
uniref:Uncharacterized protein n=1 Tax=Bionectria ochroleuca TaxID=29856 RepID=A0A8H7NIM8_BIOOC